VSAKLSTATSLWLRTPCRTSGAPARAAFDEVTEPAVGMVALALEVLVVFSPAGHLGQGVVLPGRALARPAVPASEQADAPAFWTPASAAKRCGQSDKPKDDRDIADEHLASVRQVLQDWAAIGPKANEGAAWFIKWSKEALSRPCAAVVPQVLAQLSHSKIPIERNEGGGAPHADLQYLARDEVARVDDKGKA
jgi:hypothetical protein